MQPMGGGAAAAVLLLGFWGVMAALALDRAAQRTVLSHPAVMLFDTLDQYLKQQQMRAREVFDHFDRDKRGWLTPSELAQLVQHFLKHLSEGDLKYFQVSSGSASSGLLIHRIASTTSWASQLPPITHLRATNQSQGMSPGMPLLVGGALPARVPFFLHLRCGAVCVRAGHD